MTEGDDLLAMIRQAVSQYPITAELQDMVTEVVARTVIAVMTTPRFLDRMVIVQQLRAENQALRQHTMQLERFIRLGATPAPAKKAAKKRAPAKKAVARSPQVRVKGSTAANRRAFKQGYRGS